MDLFDLTGKTAIVTGASRGLGRTFANALARAGADVAVTSRDAGHLRDTLRGDRSARTPRGRRSRWTSADEDSIDAMVAHRALRLGKIDILVNNAGCNVRKPAADVTWDDWNLDPRHQPPRAVLRRAGGRAAHDPARLRADRQHRLGDVGDGLAPASARTAPAAAASAS